MSPYRDRPREGHADSDASVGKAIVLVVLLLLLLVGLGITNQLCERQCRASHTLDGIETSPPHAPRVRQRLP